MTMILLLRRFPSLNNYSCTTSSILSRIPPPPSPPSHSFSSSSSSSSLGGVTSLKDMDAVTQFRTQHSKSVLYFTAVWCPPCKMISPIYEEFSKKYSSASLEDGSTSTSNISCGGVAFGKIDVDVNQDAAASFQISAVPTFVFSRGKDIVHKFSGADKNQLEKLVKEL